MRLSCFLDILEIVIKYLLGKHAFIGKKIRDLNKMIYLLFLSKSKLSSKSNWRKSAKFVYQIIKGLDL